jgi:pimeloyl-ACP methyl ester carboxylesterase
MVAGTYAAAHAEVVERLVLVSPVVSGPALRRRIPWPVRAWWRWRGSVGGPGSRLGVSRSGWEFMRSGWAYDLLRSAHRLTMPVMIVGAGRDVLIPPRLLRRLYGRLRGGDAIVDPGGSGNRLVVVPGARHGFDREWEQERLREVVGEWLHES